MERSSTCQTRRSLPVPLRRSVAWVFVIAWLAVAALTGPFAGKLPKVEKNEAIAYLPASAQSTKVNSALAHFPGGQQVPGVVVYIANGALSASDERVAAEQVKRAVQQFPTFHPGKPQLSKDGRALAYAFNISQPDATKLASEVTTLRRALSGGPHLRAYVTGVAGTLADSTNAFKGIDGLLLAVTGLVVIVLLLLIYRSPVLWLLPLLSVASAIGLSNWSVYELARHAGVTVSGETGGILTVLVFGAGTDYALLLISRYREELYRHEDCQGAMREALAKAGPAIIASGSTVVLGLLCLLAATLNSERGLGPIGAIGIASALLAQLTFLPALLVVFGRRVFWPYKPTYGGAEPAHSTWANIAQAIARKPRQTWARALALLVILSLGLISAHLGLRSDQSFVSPPQSVVGQRAYSEHFPPGGGYPIIVVARASATRQVLESVRSTRGIARAFPVAFSHGLVEVAAIGAVSPESPAAFSTVGNLRERLAAIPGAQAMVGGQVATVLDTDHAAARDRLVVMPLVLVVVVTILGLLLRAVVGPLLLAATVVASFAASLGLSSLVFKALGFAGLDETIPLLSFIFLVALGIDYNIFMVSRIREESLRLGAEEGVIAGVKATGGVITSAGIVLAATFSALAVLPLVALVEIGFIVAFGVLLDTFLVRSVLVPALIADVGRSFWWPSSLGRLRDRARLRRSLAA
jgi:RND superfamily putative drug exporter